MSLPSSHIGRVRDLTAKIKLLEDQLMSSRLLPMSEQAIIHTELRRLKKEIDDLEKRTR
jgi:hypothetical protein